jgi:hypothetical protein
LVKVCRLSWAVVALSLVASTAAAGQAPPTLTGKVVDQRNQAPILGAIVTIAGLPGSQKTDADGKFSFEPSPAAPFQVIVVLPGGTVAKPVLIEKVDGDVTIPVNALADESVTVVGAAPSND